MAAVSTTLIFGSVLLFWSLAYYAAAVGRLQLHRRPPRPPPTGVSACTAGLWSHHRCWASTSSPPACLHRRRLVPPPTRLAYYAAVVGRLQLHRRPPRPPPTGVSACTAGLWSHHRCWASTSSPPACLHRRRLVPPPTRLAYYAAAVGRLRLHRRPASIAADWCPRLYGRLVTPPFMGVHVFTYRLAFAAADWCFRLHGWPIMPPLLGVYVFTDRLAIAAADWCFRLHGWPIMPPLLGVYDFTAGLPPSPLTGVLAYTVGWSHHRSWASMSSPTGWPSPPPTGVSACTAGLWSHHRCWASTSSPPACLHRRRLVPPPTRLAYYAAIVGRLQLHRRPPRPPPTGVSACTAGLWSHHRCWASTSSPPACLHRRRLVPPPTRLAYYAAVVGRLRLHRRPASIAADWCLRLHGWPIMPPLLGVYDFTAGLPPSPPSGASAYTASLLCRCCWASTTSPLACLCRH
uniref:cysteine dioxygenase n=1 Tax=Oryza sativa subsp. indica TaxID=39946 RepID=A0A8F2VVY8_ORYSI|nr:hypothetical protein Xa7_IRBB7.17 [Oryza sativa Indica Group]